MRMRMRMRPRVQVWTAITSIVLLLLFVVLVVIVVALSNGVDGHPEDHEYSGVPADVLVRLEKQAARLKALESVLGERKQSLQGDFAQMNVRRSGTTEKAHVPYSRVPGNALEIARQGLQSGTVGENLSAQFLSLQAKLRRLDKEAQSIVALRNQIAEIMKLPSVVSTSAVLAHAKAPKDVIGSMVKRNAVIRKYREPIALQKGVLPNWKTLPNEREKLFGNLVPGFYLIASKTMNSVSRKRIVGPLIFLQLKAGGALIGRASYQKSPKYDATETLVLGTWTSNSFEYVEDYQGRIFRFEGTRINGSSTSAPNLMSGTYSYRTSSGSKMGGKFVYALERIVFTQEVMDNLNYHGRQVVLANVTVAMGSEFGAATRYRMTGRTMNSVTKVVSVAPRISMFFWPDGTLEGTARYLATHNPRTNAIIHRAVSVRLVGRWTKDAITYIETYYGKTFSFRGALRGDGVVVGTYKFGVRGSGTFHYKAKKIVQKLAPVYITAANVRERAADAKMLASITSDNPVAERKTHKMHQSYGVDYAGHVDGDAPVNGVPASILANLNAAEKAALFGLGSPEMNDRLLQYRRGRVPVPRKKAVKDKIIRHGLYCLEMTRHDNRVRTEPQKFETVQPRRMWMHVFGDSAFEGTVEYLPSLSGMGGSTRFVGHLDNSKRALEFVELIGNRTYMYECAIEVALFQCRFKYGNGRFQFRRFDPDSSEMGQGAALISVHRIEVQYETLPESAEERMKLEAGAITGLEYDPVTGAPLFAPLPPGVRVETPTGLAETTPTITDAYFDRRSLAKSMDFPSTGSVPPHRLVPVDFVLRPGLYKVEGVQRTFSRMSASVSPKCMLWLRKDGTISGYTEYEPSVKYDETIVRLTGRWDYAGLRYAESYYGRLYQYSGKVEQPGTTGKVSGQYIFGSRGRGAFDYSLRLVKFDHSRDRASAAPATDSQVASAAAMQALSYNVASESTKARVNAAVQHVAKKITAARGKISSAIRRAAGLG